MQRLLTVVTVSGGKVHRASLEVLSHCAALAEQHGAEAAARHHFGKSASELTEDEAAWLAAILPSPRRYDPLRKTTSLARRQERVLHRMSQIQRQQTRVR